MTRPSTPPILSELRSPSSPASQVVALRALKNEIVGHEQKKEMWIGLGVVAPLTRILNTHRVSGKRRHRNINSSIEVIGRGGSRTDEEEARLQAIIIVGSLAYGGPAYVSPLSTGSVFPPLLSIICPTESSPQLVLAALRALNTIADSILLERSRADAADDTFLKLLYTDQYLTSLVQVLDQSSSALVIQQQISLAANLIAKTCKTEPQRKLLVLAGVLSALANRLASFIVATGNHVRSTQKGGLGPICEITPATTRSRLSPILYAIGTVIINSKFRPSQFACAAVFTSIFPRAEVDPYSWRAPPDSGKRQMSKTNIDALPPTSSSSLQRNPRLQTANFPPLGALGSRGKYQHTSRGLSSALEIIPTGPFYNLDDDETPLVTWLIQVVRGETGLTRLMACWVLTLLYRSGFVNRQKEPMFALLLVPVLVRMLDTDYKTSQEVPYSYDSSTLQTDEWLIKEHAPAVLATLVVESLELQKAAVDAGAIKRLTQILKQSYDPLPARCLSAMWSPCSLGNNRMSLPEVSSASKLGMGGLSPREFHILQMRESVLKALAALAAVKDEYRKAIIDNGVVPIMIESLKASMEDPGGASSEMGEVIDKPNAIGNPTSVLLAACSTARALSRSVSTLRTSLIDAGLAEPLYVLLKHQNMEVQIAATAVVCNLVLEFSPMREKIIEAGILKTLCEHAHSMNAKLRLNSIWALKHLVHTAPNELKIKCLEELGPGWLKHIICNNTEDVVFSLGNRGGDRDTGGSTPITLGTPNAAGEQVDLLNAVEYGSVCSNRVVDEDEDEVKMIDSIGTLSKPELDYKHRSGHTRVEYNYSATSDQQRLVYLQDDDYEVAVQARKDDLAVQEQGLDFVRNLICGQGSSEMIDYIFRELGQDRLFDILASKLRPKAIDAFSRDRRSLGNGVTHVPPQAEIVVSVCYIIVHIAAGLPRHRQLLISQGELLKLLVPLFSHGHSEVRVCCAWLVINLTWTDDQSDKLHCKARAHELRKLGILEKLEELECDQELDVRERTKTAISQMSDLLR